MLYLAEVQKQKTGIMGVKTELRLLACQRNDQSWNATEEVISAPPEEINKYENGVLVLVEIGGNRQVQRTEPAGRSLVSRLESFSRQLDKAKKQEEEIEQWKQSLTYQSQELNRREMEMEARLEQLQQLEEDFERLEQQRQEVESAQEAIEKLKEECDRNHQEMEGAWEHLRGEQRRWEERLAEFKQSAGLDEEQAAKMRELLNRLSGAIAPTESVQEQLNSALAVVNSQQEGVNYHWQHLEQQRNTAQKLQAEIDQQAFELQNRQPEWQQAQASLDQANIELKVQQNALDIKQESASILSLQLQNQDQLYEQVTRLATTSDSVKISQQVDIQALEQMPLGELQAKVQQLQHELTKLLQFVNDQEEELTLQRQDIEELEQKINLASEYDRLSLENELAEQQDSYQMRDESLVGQRRSLREREEILASHVRVLRRRQGIAETDAGDSQKIDLGPVLTQLETQRQQLAEYLQKLESQIDQMRSSIEQAQEMTNHLALDSAARDKELQNMEQNLQHSRVVAAELWGQVNLYQETLQPLQNGLNESRQKLEAIALVLNQVQEMGSYQQQTITEMQQTFNSFIEAGA